MTKCKWCNLKNPKHIEYYVNELCKINFNDKYLYEMLILEPFQAELSDLISKDLEETVIGFLNSKIRWKYLYCC